MSAPPRAAYSFAHLLAMSTPVGTFEHAEHTTPRTAHGFCTDDMARVLVVTSREPAPGRAVRELGATACRFLAAAQDPTGRSRNRRSATGRWEDRPGVEDCWGRGLWGLGTAFRLVVSGPVGQMAGAHFDHGAQQRSPWPRAMAFAALGAAEVLAVDPHHVSARQLLADAAAMIGSPGAGPDWRWPEDRLTYANAVLAEALIAAGDLLSRSELIADGLDMLGWLLSRETNDGHLSPTPVGGSGPGDHGPGFDQQPIEVAAMADACQRAASVSGDPVWLDGVDLAARWFRGHNDAGTAMWDEASGGGYDGLHATGPNLNQGAESTLALLSTLQHERRLAIGLSPRGA